MPTFATAEIPPPKFWQEFEDICCDLWRKQWNDPNAMKHGRTGQPQNGVDVYGRPDSGNIWAGVQCKKKDNLADSELTEKELLEEVEKAKSFTPGLSSFTIATTGQRDATLQQIAREITAEHLKKGAFSVDVYFWEDIQGKLADYQDLLTKHFLGCSCIALGLGQMVNDANKVAKELSEVSERISAECSTIQSTYRASVTEAASGPAEEAVFHDALDYTRELLERNEPTQVIAQLKRFRLKSWDKAGSTVRFRVLTNLACAEMQLRNLGDAGHLFVEALQYKPQDEKGLTNAALGHLLLDQRTEAKKAVEQVLKLNPISARAHMVNVQLMSRSNGFAAIHDSVPKCLHNDPEVCYTLGHIAREMQDLAESERMFRTGIGNSKGSDHEIRASLAAVILQEVSQRNRGFILRLLRPEDEERLKEALCLLDGAWAAISQTELARQRIDILVNRSTLKKGLGDIEGALKDVEDAEVLDAGNISLKKQRIALLHDAGLNKEAIQLLRPLVHSKDFPEAAVMLAELELLSKLPASALETLERSDVLKGEGDLGEEARRLHVDALSKLGEYERAKKEMNRLREQKPQSILILSQSSEVFRTAGDRLTAEKIHRDALGLVNDSTPTRDIIALADELYDSELFLEAIPLYRRVCLADHDTPATRRLINCCYRAGEYGIALERCRSIAQNGQRTKYISEVECSILGLIGDHSGAMACCEAYLAEKEPDLGIQVCYAEATLRAGKNPEIPEMAQAAIESDTLDLDEGIRLGRLLSLMGQHELAVKALYGLRRRHFGNERVHMAYVSVFLARSKEDDSWLDVDQVREDAAVCVRLGKDAPDWHIIETLPDPEMARKEFCSEHPLIKKLWGAKKSETINMEGSFGSRTDAVIMDLKSKYVYALHESMEKYNHLFPNAVGFQKITVDIGEGEEAQPKGMDQILEPVRRMNRRRVKVEELYRSHPLPVGCFSEMVGRDIVETFGGLIANPELGIRCCDGTTAELQVAESSLEGHPPVVVDALSLLTLHGIRAQDVALKVFKEIFVVQSVVDCFCEIIAVRSQLSSDGMMTIGMEGDSFVRTDVSAEQVQDSIEHLRGIVDWCNSRCTVIPCTASLSLNATKKSEIDKNLGRSFHDTALTASERSLLLFSDDKWFRALAKGEYNVNGIWSQPVLMKALRDGALQFGEYCDMVIRLYNANFRHTTMDGKVLLEAAKRANYEVNEPLRPLLRILSGGNSDIGSAISVALDFLFGVLNQPLVPIRYDFLGIAVLDSLCVGRSADSVIAQMISQISVKYRLLPLVEAQLIGLIDVWRRTRGV